MLSFYSVRSLPHDQFRVIWVLFILVMEVFVEKKSLKEGFRLMLI